MKASMKAQLCLGLFGLLSQPINTTQGREELESTEDFFDDGVLLSDLLDVQMVEGYSIDPVLGKINVQKALKDRANAIRREDEALNK